jgi:hypothetical protein
VLFLLVITYFIYAIYPINKQIFLPLYISFYLSLLFAFLALGMHGGGRYGFVSAVLVFTFLVNTVVFRGQKKQLIIIVLLAFIFLSGLFKFFDTKNFYNSSWVSFKPENVEVLGENLYGLKVFPQWPNVNWEIKFNKEELERY